MKKIFVKMKDTHTILVILLSLLAMPGAISAQETLRETTQLQTTEFFDPTRKKEEAPYQFSTDWRFELGYAQYDERQNNSSIFYQHGVRIGATVDCNLPYHFSIQTGALATLTYGINQQHWTSMTEESAQVERMEHNIVQLQLTIPVRAYYTINLWRKLNMFFYAGPQLQIGLTNYDILENYTSALCTEYIQGLGLPIDSHDSYVTKELHRVNVQFGLGGGFEWDRYRLQAGYDFGLNNLIRTAIVPKQQLSEWGWMISFAYRL